MRHCRLSPSTELGRRESSLSRACRADCCESVSDESAAVMNSFVCAHVCVFEARNQLSDASFLRYVRQNRKFHPSTRIWEETNALSA